MAQNTKLYKSLSKPKVKALASLSLDVYPFHFVKKLVNNVYAYPVKRKNAKKKQWSTNNEKCQATLPQYSLQIK